jgi:hypothetical protein
VSRFVVFLYSSLHYLVISFETVPYQWSVLSCFVVRHRALSWDGMWCFDAMWCHVQSISNAMIYECHCAKTSSFKWGVSSFVLFLYMVVISCIHLCDIKHIRVAGGLGRGIPFLSDSFFSHRILAAWFGHLKSIKVQRYRLSQTLKIRHPQSTQVYS